MRASARIIDLTVLTCVVPNALAGSVMDAVSEAGWLAAAMNLFGVSAVVWIAFALAALRLGHDPHDAQVSVWPALLVGLACLIPSAQLAWAAGALWFGGRIAQSRFSSGELQAGHLIALALCARTPVTWLMMTLLAEPLLQVDAVLAGWLATLMTPIAGVESNIVVNASGHRLFVMTGCSSWNNLSLALLFWFAMTRGLLTRDQLPPWWHGVAVGASVVLINTVRLAVMAVSAEYYAWLHDGSGADVVLAVTALVVAAATFFSLRGGRHAPAAA